MYPDIIVVTVALTNGGGYNDETGDASCFGMFNDLYISLLKLEPVVYRFNQVSIGITFRIGEDSANRFSISNKGPVSLNSPAGQPALS